MLQSIRDRTQGWIAGTIISILILSFALWGIHSYFTSGPVSSAVAEVNGIEISKPEFNITYERLKRQLQTDYPNYDISFNVQKLLKKRALESLITVEALKQASVEQNYEISPIQINNFLKNMPEFQVQGEFSAEHFQQVLSNTFLSTNDFINLIKTTLLIDQPRLGIIFSSFTLPDEVLQSIDLIKQQRDIQYTTLLLKDFTKQSINIPQEKAQLYYQQHKSRYKMPEKISIEYLILSIKNVMQKIHPNENELKTFYSENSNLFTSATEKTFAFDKIKEKVKEAYLRQIAEEKFANLREQLANITYEHPDTLESASRQLGLPLHKSELFTYAQGGKDISANPKVREAAFSNDVLNLNNNSEIVQISTQAVVVLRIKSRVPAAFISYPLIENKIIDQLKKEEADKLIFARAKQICDAFNQGEKFEKVTAQNHLNWKLLGLVQRHSAAADPSILTVAFTMALASNKNIITYALAKIPDGYAIIGLKAIKNAPLDKNTYHIFAEQMQNTQGLLEYELYKKGLLHKAKIKIENKKLDPA